jgi:hypothetical protein
MANKQGNEMGIIYLIPETLKTGFKPGLKASISGFRARRLRA